MQIGVKNDPYSKGAVSKFSDEIYEVVKINGYRLLVRNVDTKRLSTVLYHDVVNTLLTTRVKQHSKLKELKKNISVVRKNVREEVKNENIVVNKCERKPKVILDL